MGLDAINLTVKLEDAAAHSTIELAPILQFSRMCLELYTAGSGLTDIVNTRQRRYGSVFSESCIKNEYHILKKAGQHDRVPQRSNV